MSHEELARPPRMAAELEPRRGHDTGRRTARRRSTRLRPARGACGPHRAARPRQQPRARPRTRVPDLDVLFIGAHPDDEAFALSTYGQWNEDNDIRTGVITITRGEGGGNAVGPEEGPALGLIREAEERRAVGRAGITDVYNLDQVDFYYTVSAPLTEQVWGHDDTLERGRPGRPRDPARGDRHDGPGTVAGQPRQPPVRRPDGLRGATTPPATRRRSRAAQRRGARPGRRPSCCWAARAAPRPDRARLPDDVRPRRAPTQNIYGVWSGRPVERYGKTWAQVEREAQREYAIQGWAVFPDVLDRSRTSSAATTSPRWRRGCPFVRGDLAAAAADPTRRAARRVRAPAPAAFPLGTGLEVDADPFAVTPGGTTTLTRRRDAPRPACSSELERDAVGCPTGWTVDRRRDARAARDRASAATRDVHASRRRTTRPPTSGCWPRSSCTATSGRHGPR